MITRLHLFTTNAYLVRHRGAAFLVDSGLPRDWERLLKLLRSHDIKPEQLRAVIHTHGHSDHVGNSARLQKEFRLPLVLHRNEIERVQSGENGPLTPASWMAPFTHPFIVEHFPPFTPDIILDETLDLSSLGFPGDVLWTPGHTRGSLSFIMGHEAIIGDIIRGSLIPWKRTGAPHFFQEDAAQARRSVETILARGVRVLHPGHFQNIRL